MLVFKNLVLSVGTYLQIFFFVIHTSNWSMTMLEVINSINYVVYDMNTKLIFPDNLFSLVLSFTHFII